MTNMVEFVINEERFKTKMPNRKSESINVNKNQELSEYIDITNGALLDTYDYLAKHTRQLLETKVLTDAQRSYLEWSLVHIHTDMLKLHESLKNMQKALREDN